MNTDIVGDSIAHFMQTETDPNRIVTGWVVVVMTQTFEDDPGTAAYRLITAPAQPYALTEGLVSIARKLQTDQWNDND